VSQTVNPANTTTTVSSSVNPAGVNQPITLIATVASVSPSQAVPAGTVTFFVNNQPLSPTVMVQSNGQAQLPFKFRTIGTFNVTAQYTPTSNFLSNPSNTFSESVLKETTTTLATSAATAVPGSTFTLTATVRAAVAGNPQPAGTVTFNISDSIGTLVYTQSVALSSLGVARLPLLAGSPPLNTGDYTVQAVYNGQPKVYATSTSKTLNQGIHFLAKTVLSTSANPLTVGNTVTFTATVTPVSPATADPPGSVIFYINGVAQPRVPLGFLASGGYGATFSTSSLAAGPRNSVASYAIKAVYVPSTSDFATSTSATLIQKVQPLFSRLAAVFSPRGPVTGSAFSMTVVAMNAQNQVATQFNGSGSIKLISAPANTTFTPYGFNKVNVTFQQGRVTLGGLVGNKIGTYTFQITAGTFVTYVSVFVAGRTV
jgi:hypothetical protein